MRLTQCKVKNKHVTGSSFSPIMRHYFSDGRIIPLFLLLLSSLPTIHLTIKDHVIWNVVGLSIAWFLSKTGLATMHEVLTKDQETIETEKMKAHGRQLESKW